MIPLFKVNSYQIYFGENENEFVNVHVSKDGMTNDATKIWLSNSGGGLVCHNNSKIDLTKLYLLRRFVEAFSDRIIEAWKKYFGEVKFYC